MSDVANGWVEVAGYRLDTGCYFDADTNVWARFVAPDRVRVGLDPLGAETCGSLAQVALLPAGTEVRRGQPLGSIEAEKFVGPLVAPLSGTILAGNDAAVTDPRIVHADPFGDGWLVEISPSDPADTGRLVHGAGEVAAWFEAKVADYRLRGVLAE